MVDAPGPLGGGKFKPYVKAIMEAEKAPLRQIEARKAKEGERLKLLQEFTSKVRKISEGIREIKDFKKFRELKVDIGENKDFIGVDVDKNVADTGEYQVEVVQLAGRHSMISNGFSSADAEVGVGYFSYETPSGETKSLYINPGNNTLKDLANALNNDPDINVQAMVVNDGTGSDTPWKLIVSGKKTGMSEDFHYPEFYFVDGDMQFVMDDERAAQSAIIKLNGFEVMADKNRITDLIPGVTLDLKQAKEGHEINVSINEDIPKISAKLKTFVDSINSVLEFINKQNQLDEKTDTSKTLGGDGMLRTIESQLRMLIQSPIAMDEDGEKTQRLMDLGINFQRTGLLALNQEKFQAVLAKDFNSVATFFTGSNGLVEKLETLTDSWAGPVGGLLVDRERGFRSKMQRMDDQMAQKEAQLGRREEFLKRQFSNLEATLQNMQGQQQYVAQALGGSASALPGL